MIKTDFLNDNIEASSPSKVIVSMNGEDILNQESLMDRVAEAMQFPEYFGRNWNALEDCLRDLQWLPAESYRLVWKEAHHLLLASPEDFMTFIDIYSDVTEWWWKQGVVFQLWIQDDLILRVAEFCKRASIMT